MKGNVNKNVEIRDEDRCFYNVLMEKRIVDPRDPKHPIVRKYLKVFRIIDYKRYFQCSSEDQIGFLQAMNFDNAELVHDPSLETYEMPEPIITAEHEKMEFKIRKPLRKITKRK